MARTTSRCCVDCQILLNRDDGWRCAPCHKAFVERADSQDLPRCHDCQMPMDRARRIRCPLCNRRQHLLRRRSRAQRMTPVGEARACREVEIGGGLILLSRDYDDRRDLHERMHRILIYREQILTSGTIDFRDPRLRLPADDIDQRAFERRLKALESRYSTV